VDSADRLLNYSVLVEARRSVEAAFARERPPPPIRR
jgi:hypothetical protein